MRRGFLLITLIGILSLTSWLGVVQADPPYRYYCEDWDGEPCLVQEIGTTVQCPWYDSAQGFCDCWYDGRWYCYHP